MMRSTDPSTGLAGRGPTSRPASDPGRPAGATAQATRRAVLACGAMVLAAGAAAALTPRRKLATTLARPDLEQAVPRQFGEWHVDPRSGVALVNPRAADTLQRVYQQTVARNYVSNDGQRVMLSLTYGEDQRADMALHYPEICYPAQGFAVRSNRVGELQLSPPSAPATDAADAGPGRLQGHLSVRRLETTLGTQRPEAVTYWTTIGEYRSLSNFERRLIELRYGLAVLIPDGYLCRISSIGADSAHEFVRQERFVQGLLAALAPAALTALIGQRVEP